MKTHELKCWPNHFEAIARGEKTAELRKDDRGFSVGDQIVLAEWDPATYLLPPHAVKGYTGRKFGPLEITHILEGERWGLISGNVMLSFQGMPELTEQKRREG